MAERVPRKPVIKAEKGLLSPQEEGFLLSAVMVEDGAAEDYVLLKQKPQSPNRREPDDSKDPETS